MTRPPTKRPSLRPPVQQHPPHSIEAEQSVIGGLLLNNAAWDGVSAIISGDDFYTQDHRVIWEAMAQVLASRRPCDFVTLSEHLRSANRLEAAGGIAYLGTLAADTPSAANVLAYAEIVRERSLLRALIRAAEAARELGFKPDGQEFSAVLSRSLQHFDSLRMRVEAGTDEAWLRHLTRASNGTIKSCFANVTAVLKYHPEWRGKLRLDTFKHQIVKVGAPIGTPLGLFDDTDAAEIAAWMGSPGNLQISCSPDQVRAAALVAARLNSFNPVVDYLSTREWDNEPRIDDFFSDFCNAPKSEYTIQVARNLFLGAVARAVKPGSKFDLMLVLEGPQGAKKTSLVIELAGEEFYAEAQESPAVKDFYQGLNGPWFVEIGEMHSFSKVEATKINQAITARWDFYRPSYGHFAKNHPRQCVFVATANKDNYWRDETGARRLMPIKVSSIDLRGIAAVRDQLWAEAYFRYQKGEAFWDLPESASAEQERRYKGDSWSEPITRWLAGHGSSYPEGMDPRNFDFVIMTQILLHACHTDIARQDLNAQQRVGAIMARLGWERRQRRLHGVQTWGYIRPPPAPPVPIVTNKTVGDGNSNGDNDLI